MRFARIVFTGAGIWGIAVLLPLLFMFDYVGRAYPPAITHADFYYGFVVVALAWQVAFLMIGRDPVRFRAFMPMAMLEKFGYVTTLIVLFFSGQLELGQFAPAIPDFVLGLLFVAAFRETNPLRGSELLGQQHRERTARA